MSTISHSYRHTSAPSLAMLIATVVLVAGLAGPAAARSPLPPEQSGANQYTEALPGAGGNEPTGTIGVGRGGPPGKAIGDENADRLEGLGPEGEAAAELAAKAAPAAMPAGSQPGSVGPSSLSEPGPGTGSEADGDSASGQILGQLAGDSDSGGMGVLLPLVIVLTAAVAVTFLVVRRRTSPGAG